MHDKLEKCENTIAELRSTNVKLNAEVEYQTERFKILSGNVDTYKKEINGLRERNEKSMAILAKHEQSITHLTDVSTFLVCGRKSILRNMMVPVLAAAILNRRGESIPSREWPIARTTAKCSYQRIDGAKGIAAAA